MLADITLRLKAYDRLHMTQCDVPYHYFKDDDDIEKEKVSGSKCNLFWDADVGHAAVGEF